MGVPGVLLMVDVVPRDGGGGVGGWGGIHSFVMFKGKAESLFLRPCHILCAYQFLPVPVASIVPFACCLTKQELQTSSKHRLFYQEESGQNQGVFLPSEGKYAQLCLRAGLSAVAKQL